MKRILVEYEVSEELLDTVYAELEDALDTCLESAYQLQSKILDAVEHEMGCGEWDDEIYNLIYSDDKDPEEIYDLIKKGN